jgi:hypothetical protein
LATLSLILPNASDCEVRPLIALFIAPKIDIVEAPDAAWRSPRKRHAGIKTLEMPGFSTTGLGGAVFRAALARHILPRSLAQARIGVIMAGENGRV